MIILPYFLKRGCWILSKSHLLSIKISRIEVLKSRNYSQNSKTNYETSDPRYQLLWKNLYLGVRKKYQSQASKQCKYYVMASRLLGDDFIGDEMNGNPIIHSESERSKVKQA